VLLIWDPDLVQSFKNAPEHYSEKPTDLITNFEKENQTAVQFIEANGSTSQAALSRMQDFLLGALRNPDDVSIYSKLHENAMYRLGYNHGDTVRLAYM
jgi:RNA-dependent RNA polymerase